MGPSHLAPALPQKTTHISPILGDSPIAIPGQITRVNIRQEISGDSMSNSDTSEAVDFGAAAAYRIVVQGTLEERCEGAVWRHT